MRLLRILRRVPGTVAWYARGISGADAYERYVDHLRRVHPGAEIPSRRQFWRDKHDEQSRNPSTRCC